MLVALVGDVMILTAIYHRGVVLFVTCLVIPFAALAFALVHLRRLWFPSVFSLGGCLLVCGGVWLSGSESLAEFQVDNSGVTEGPPSVS